MEVHNSGVPVFIGHLLRAANGSKYACDLVEPVSQVCGCSQAEHWQDEGSPLCFTCADQRHTLWTKQLGIEHPGTWLIGASLKNMEIDGFFSSCPEVKKGGRKKIHLQKTAEILPTDNSGPDRHALFVWRCAKQDVVLNMSWQNWDISQTWEVQEAISWHDGFLKFCSVSSQVCKAEHLLL